MQSKHPLIMCHVQTERESAENVHSSAELEIYIHWWLGERESEKDVMISYRFVYDVSGKLVNIYQNITPQFV